ncbi:MAG TPA: alpha-isopropylmalate synthase regulatory domain-containing protein [Candidatus Limnocylindrales bacterium]|nr:alpha-isopropylmalate synthase regulatory domain-containing protein [Candidatus Limnocylindrales bacterium]
MSSTENAAAGTTAPVEHLRLVRWSASLGSNVQSRGSVVVQSGDHRWEGSAKGTGPVDALFRAVDSAMQDVLGGHPRLLSYDVHAIAEGFDAEGRVTIRIAPPEDAPGSRGQGTYEASAQSPNIVAASVEAYIEAIEQMLAEEQWAGATDAAGNFRAAARSDDERAEYTGERPDHSRWWQ